MGLKEKLKEHEEGLDEVKKNKKIQQFKQFEKRYNQKKKEKEAQMENGRAVSYDSRKLKKCNKPENAAQLYVAIEQSKGYRFPQHSEKGMVISIIEFKKNLELKEVGKDHQVYKDLEELAGEALESSKRGVKERGRLKNYKAVIEKLGEAYS